MKTRPEAPSPLAAETADLDAEHPRRALAEAERRRPAKPGV